MGAPVYVAGSASARTPHKPNLNRRVISCVIREVFHDDSAPVNRDPLDEVSVVETPRRLREQPCWRFLQADA